MMKRLVIYGLLWACVMTGWAKTDPVVKEVRKTVKDARYQLDGNEAKKVTDRLNDAERKLMEILPKQKTGRQKAQCYYMAAMVQRKFNTIENEKLYLKKGMDTVLFYQSIHKMYNYLFQADSAETTDKGRRLKYRKRARKHLLAYRANLLSGGRYYLKNKKYDQALELLDCYLSSAHHPILANDFLYQTDTLYSRAAYWAVTSAYYIGNFESVVRYKDEALKYHKNKIFIQEYVCKSYLALGDTSKWVKALTTGLVNYPDHTYFFTNLLDYFNEKKKYDTAIQFADYMISYNPKMPLYWFAKAAVYMKMKNYEQCIAYCDDALALDSMHYGANLYKGIGACQLAADAIEQLRSTPLSNPNYARLRSRILNYYQLAMPHLERVRKMQPQEEGTWAPLLYAVYLHLNKGKEFAEMDAILQKINSEKQSDK